MWGLWGQGALSGGWLRPGILCSVPTSRQLFWPRTAYHGRPCAWMGALKSRGAPLGVCGSHEGAAVTLTQMGKPTLTKVKYFKHSQDLGEGGVTGQSQPRRLPGSHEGHLRSGGLGSAEACVPMRTLASISGCRAGAGMTDISGSEECSTWPERSMSSGGQRWTPATEACAPRLRHGSPPRGGTAWRRRVSERRTGSDAPWERQ